ncbi:MAG TPA: septum formation initiator family protein [Acidimicrobiia bacterium]
MSSKARIAVASVVFVGFVFGAVFPTRTYLAQRREIAAAAERLELFTAQNGRLQSAVDRLQRDDEIERLARSRYNLVRPGEEAYAILPVPAPPPVVPVPVKPPPHRPNPLVAWVQGTLDRVF